MGLSHHPAQALALKDWAFPLSYSYKQELRPFMRKKRASQDQRVIQHKNRKITKNVLTLEEVQQANCIAAYASLPEEAGTQELLSTLLEQGKRVVLPKVTGKTMDFFRIVDPVNNMQQGAFSILEPDPERCERVEAEAIDVFLVPGTTFDCFGARIGFGGGYYDRFMRKKTSHVKAIALAFEFQVVHAMETQTHDIPVDCIVTETHIYEPRLSSYITCQEEETRELAKQLTQSGWEQGQVLALHGDLGTGKTVFVQGAAHAIGAQETVASPTFIYSREYSGEKKLYHIDGYRLDSIANEDELFWDEQLNRDGLIAVEWAERLDTLLPKSSIHLFGKVVDLAQREWTLFTPLRKQASLHIKKFRKE